MQLSEIFRSSMSYCYHRLFGFVYLLFVRLFVGTLKNRISVDEVKSQFVTMWQHKVNDEKTFPMLNIGKRFSPSIHVVVKNRL